MRYILISFLLSISLFFSCAKKEFGKYIEYDKRTRIEYLKRYPKNYLNRFIMIKGRVVEESEKGGWINVQDGNFTISVNLEPNGIILKNSILSNKVMVIGRLVQTKDGYMISGRYLKIE